MQIRSIALAALVAPLLFACKDKPTAIPEDPATLTASPATVTSLAAQPVPDDLRLVVRDANGTGVPGETVTFSVVEGGGTLATATATSGAGGVVVVPTWTFGKSAVPQRLRATLGTITTDISGTVQSSYHIDVKFYGPIMTQQQRDAFTSAANRLRAIITGDQPPVQMNVVLTGCSEQSINEIVDDVAIYASVQNIDGEGGILASAGPCYVRDGTDIPVVGVMQFDGADLNEITQLGLLQDVILHEMLHVIGIGSIWVDKGLLVGAGTNDPRFTGAQARAACQAVGGGAICAASVPVENVGGAGSADAHWRETTFNRELMTSGSENAPPMPLSRMTIASLADLGYVVNTAPFDSYVVGSALRQDAATASLPPRWEGTGPRVIHRVDPSGRIISTRVR